MTKLTLAQIEFKAFKKAQDDQVNTLKQALQKKTKEYLEGEFARLFAENPALKSFAWPQYTPYFCDGDPCSFGAHTSSYSIRINGVYDEDEAEAEESDGKELSSKDREKLKKLVAEVLCHVGKNELESLYGEGLVSVTPKKVTVEDYDHD